MAELAHRLKISSTTVSKSVLQGEILAQENQFTVDEYKFNSWEHLPPLFQIWHVEKIGDLKKIVWHVQLIFFVPKFEN